MRKYAASLLVAAVFIAAPALGLAQDREAALKAAFILNFAKYTEWPGLPYGAPIIACVYRDDAIGTALAETVRGQRIGGHAIDVRPATDASAFSLCHVLFVGAAELRRTEAALRRVTTLPVLTVSDGKGFSKSGGIIEMFVEGGRINFAINVTSAERSGLRISARLLGLARIVKSTDAF